MASVFDVAKYILNKKGRMSPMKLQKLVYYSQCWSLAWDDKPLFNNRIEAWANGPVVRDLYTFHRLQFEVTPEMFAQHTTGLLTETEIETIDLVLEAYGDKSPQWLSDQTHSELPWKQARIGLQDGERGENEISLESMSEYYSSLQ
jgi:uncharacterized phage-associated protein